MMPQDITPSLEETTNKLNLILKFLSSLEFENAERDSNEEWRNRVIADLRQELMRFRANIENRYRQLKTNDSQTDHEKAYLTQRYHHVVMETFSVLTIPQYKVKKNSDAKYYHRVGATRASRIGEAIGTVLLFSVGTGVVIGGPIFLIGLVIAALNPHFIFPFVLLYAAFGTTMGLGFIGGCVKAILDALEYDLDELGAYTTRDLSYDRMSSGPLSSNFLEGFNFDHLTKVENSVIRHRFEYSTYFKFDKKINALKESIAESEMVSRNNAATDAMSKLEGLSTAQLQEMDYSPSVFVNNTSRNNKGPEQGAPPSSPGCSK